MSNDLFCISIFVLIAWEVKQFLGVSKKGLRGEIKRKSKETKCSARILKMYYKRADAGEIRLSNQFQFGLWLMYFLHFYFFLC